MNEQDQAAPWRTILDRAIDEIERLRACVKAADAMRGEGYEPRPSVAKVQAYDAARERVQLD